MAQSKKGACERCTRPIINIHGRCLPCNYLYKHKRYYPGLRSAPEYDAEHGFDLKIVEAELKRAQFLPIHKVGVQRKPKSESSTENTEVIARETAISNCEICQKDFHPSQPDHQICYKCYRFFRDYGGIKSYQQFLEAFQLPDSANTRENYIEFVDTRSKFLDIYGDWKVDKILENPRAYLDKVKAREKRAKPYK